MCRAIAWKALSTFGTKQNDIGRDLNKTHGRHHLPKCEIIEVAAVAETMHSLLFLFLARKRTCRS